MKGTRNIILAVVFTLAAISQIVLAFVFYDPEATAWIINIGWLILFVSAFFGWVPILTFRKKGDVKGRSYIHTTKLVDSGVYSIVRHPQYLAGVLINIALPMITRHWSVIASGIVAAVVNYASTFDEEKACIEKFGDDYLRYMDHVPRLNFLLGVARVVLMKR